MLKINKPLSDISFNTTGLCLYIETGTIAISASSSLYMGLNTAESKDP